VVFPCRLRTSLQATERARTAAVIERQTIQLGLGLELTDNADADVVTPIARIPRGNFRLVERLFAQIQRVVQINDLPAITREAVAVASESLVIGPL
jgi:hypothetical protein